MKISGYVPFYNNAATVLAAVDSLRRQTLPLDEFFAVDDGSTDNGACLLEAAGVKVLRQSSNLGRGSARARAMREARHGLVVSCDATKILPSDFTTRALHWFNDPMVASVHGRIRNHKAGSAVDRWQSRYLFREEVPMSVDRQACFITYGSIVRRSAVEQAGGFDPTLRHSEDIDLGQRLLARGFEVIYDPSLPVESIGCNKVFGVLERYWRWNAGPRESLSLADYMKASWFSLRDMSWNDLRQGQPGVAAISAFSPHYCFFKSLGRRLSGKAQ